MSDVVPHPLLFRFSIPVKRWDGKPKRGSKLFGLGPEFQLPNFGELQAALPIAELRMGWNDDGLGFCVRVRGKRLKPVVYPKAPTRSDGLQVWLDTRNTQSIHRASRYCHRFGFLPLGDGADEKSPWGVQLPIEQARESAPLAAHGSLIVGCELLADGYQLEAWVRRDQLQGFDPAADREAGTPTRLGFFYCLRDAELGIQTLTVDEKFPFESNPSLWSTLELVS